MTTEQKTTLRNAIKEVSGTDFRLPGDSLQYTYKVLSYDKQTRFGDEESLLCDVEVYTLRGQYVETIKRWDTQLI
jgi:hypothetical protein